MPKIVRMTGRVLGLFLVLALAGVGLTLFTELVGLVDGRRETTALLGYVIWSVVGVFCGTFIYFSSEGEPDSPEGRRTGLTVLGVTMEVALLLGSLSALVGSGSEAAQPIAPEHRGVTLTYLVTVVLTIAAARFVVFRERPASVGAGASFARASRNHDPPEALQRALAPRRAAARTPESPALAAFRPASFWGTLAFSLGVPLLLFLDVSLFVLGPFDVFDRWTSPLLSGALVLGLSWGLAAARWQRPRNLLWLAHAPLLMGTLFYFFGLLPGALFVAVNAPDWLSDAAPLVGFALGFTLGLVALVTPLAESLGDRLTRASTAEPARRAARARKATRS